MDEPRRLGGRYELGSVLGRGGMAEVYLAHDTRLGRTVAVKTLRADMARDPSFQARFRREAQSAASLNHPAIVAVYDTGEDYIDNVSIPYIVMEYVDGSTLRELLHSGRKLLPERAAEMCTGILQALEYSHRSGIVHRDIKPANVMLTRTGQVKVMDFGIARAMGDSGMTMTQTAAVIGTAQYLSPEQAKGEQVDARSDLYSTGCLLYELLTNRPPFVGDSPVAVAYQHVREEPQAPSVFDPEISPELDAIVMKALVKDPDYRYQSADEMRADIEAALEGQPVAATAAMGAVGYGGDGPPTTALTPQGGYGGGSMLPPSRDDDGGMGYDDRPDRRRQQPRRNGSLSTVLLVLAGILVLVGAIFIGKSIFGGKPSTKQTVPALVGQKFAEAQQSVANSDLKLAKGGSTHCKKDQVNTIRKQSPAPDTEVDKGATITVTVCTGVSKVTVPDVVGQPASDAQTTLADKGFKVTPKQVEADGQTPGNVIKQDPTGGTKAAEGATITLSVAKAPDNRDVPSVIGKDKDEATQILKDAGFAVQAKGAESADQPENTVIDQSPKEGQAKAGSTVVITYATPVEQVQVPDVAGQSLKDASKTLSDAGLKIRVQPGNPTNHDALVTGINPVAGTTVNKGDEVVVLTAGGMPPGGDQ
ncbi:MAG: Stk1 family PASTA domain-containing Ser/Thr kinase [Streptomyces sp.]|jgi:serine/threonine-protein kinase|nr:Stk1 family PASTA domain-containing Ser/Thr kinase [Streptomyces sp.]